jgi:hypothetical protein
MKTGVNATMDGWEVVALKVYLTDICDTNYIMDAHVTVYACTLHACSCLSPTVSKWRYLYHTRDVYMSNRLSGISL